MGLGSSIEGGHLTTRLDADVILSRSTFGHDVGREIRDGEEDFTNLRFCFRLLFLEALAQFLELSYLRADSFGLLLSTLLHQITDLLSEGFLT